MGVRTCSEAWSTWQVTCKGGKLTRDLLTTHEKQSFFPTALPFFLNYMTLRPSFIFLSFDTDTGIEILLNYEKNHGMRAMMKGSASVPGRQQGWVGPVLLPQRQLDSHWLLLCGNSSPRLPAISISRKRQKSLRFLTVASKQTKKTPLHGPNGSCLCTGSSPEATSLQPLAFVLLENSSWGVRSGDPRGSPPHTQTPYPNRSFWRPTGPTALSHRGSGGSRSSNGLWSKPTLGNRPIAGRLPPPATERRPEPWCGSPPPPP